MIYCERLEDVGFWVEPINALSNLFFVLAAIMVYQLIRKSEVSPKLPVYLLAIMLFIIGVGSFLWHTFAEPWAEAADVIPIMVYILLYILFFSRYVLHYTYFLASAMVGGFFLFSFLFGQAVDMSWLNGGIGYVPPILYLLFLTLLTQEQEQLKKLFPLIGLFFISLTFRSVDMSVCECPCVGTHFLWHLLNAAFLFLLIQFMVQYQEDTNRQ